MLTSSIQLQQLISGRDMIFEQFRTAAAHPRAEKPANKCLVLRIARDDRRFEQRSNTDALPKAPHAKRVRDEMAGGKANLIDHTRNLI